MQFQSLENTNPLLIEYRGEKLDLFTLGIFQLQMQDIIDKVSLGLLSQAGLLEPTWRRAKYLPRQQIPDSSRIVRAEISDLQSGSLFEAVSFAVAAAIADPHVVAVLQNLGANVVWAVASSGVRGMRRKIREAPNEFRWYDRDDDPLGVGSNLRPILLALAENNQLHHVELRFKSRTRHGDELETEIIIEGSRQ